MFCIGKSDLAGVSEGGLVQGEFDFRSKPYAAQYNPDDASNDRNDMMSAGYEDEIAEREWFPVYDALDMAAKDFIKSGRKLVKAGCRRVSDLKEGQWCVTQNADGSIGVSVRFVMFDPDDSDFTGEHHDFLGSVAAHMPKGFTAEFAQADENGSRQKYIGTKRVEHVDHDRSSESYGVETTDTYDVIETLVISKTGQETVPSAISETEEALPAGDFIEADFPAWALDYAVNAELGSVSRSEKFAVDKWFEMMDREGYDVNAVSYGDDEYFSNEPEFGLPCDCVKARLSKKVVSENEYMVSEDERLDPVAKYLV